MDRAVLGCCATQPAATAPGRRIANAQLGWCAHRRPAGPTRALLREQPQSRPGSRAAAGLQHHRRHNHRTCRDAAPWPPRRGLEAAAESGSSGSEVEGQLPPHQQQLPPAGAPPLPSSPAQQARQQEPHQSQQQDQQQRLGLKDILAFCLPVMLVPLADPIMSLIDTIALGRMADAVQLAALGPSSLLLTFSNYILFGLSVGTVSLVAERLKKQDVAAASQALASSLFLAAVGGCCLAGIFLQWGPALLRLTGADPAVLAHAAVYLRIRALALPAVLVVQVSQAGLLAQRDSLSPFKVVLATSAVSLAGDLVFIGRLGMGVAGAAVTTVLAQYLGAFLLIGALRRSRVRPYLHVPTRAELAALMDTFGILTVFYLAKNLCYLLIQTSAAQLSALVLAAHQPIWSLWCLVSFTNTPLESAALAFLPAAADAKERRHTARLLLLMGAASGVLGSAVAVGLPAVAPHLFTTNAALWVHMRSVGLQGMLAMLCCGLDVASNGCLLAIKDTAYVARIMAGCMVVLAGFLWWARENLPGLQSVWWALALFFFLRVSQSLPRVVRQLGLAGDGDSQAEGGSGGSSVLTTGSADQIAEQLQLPAEPA